MFASVKADIPWDDSAVAQTDFDWEALSDSEVYGNHGPALSDFGLDVRSPRAPNATLVALRQDSPVDTGAQLARADTLQAFHTDSRLFEPALYSRSSVNAAPVVEATAVSTRASARSGNRRA
jgi:hypothetical protein